METGQTRVVQKPIKDVLVIEDRENLQKLYQVKLQEMTLNFDCACNGAQALEYLAQTCYCLILLDYGLPDLLGTAVCRKIREDITLGHTTTPIVIISSIGDLVAQKCRRAGADKVYLKTILATSEFETIVKKYMR